ncbi:MAG: thioesterase family protein, partial [Pseudomonadota bacterium]
GFGLRWAQMGLFETYRIAGGEAGMHHFIGQFGPALQSPWSRLTDVPDLTDHLIDKIARQSDAQSGHRSIRELERVRDDNLVAILRALKKNGWGVGEILGTHEPDLPAKPATTDGLVLTADRQVPPSWTDYNDHMNETHYLEAFTEATDRLMEIVGADSNYVASGRSYFTVESHLRHLGEVKTGERIRITTQVLDGSGKKMHLFHRMLTDDGDLVATGEHLLLHVDLGTRRSCPPEAEVAQRLLELAALHAAMPVPDGAGRAVGKRDDRD